jgi:hypothetical protein
MKKLNYNAMRSWPAAAALLLLAYIPAPGDSVKPFHYGPFVKNEINLIAAPTGYDYVLSNGFYHFQLGWIEPIADASGGGIFQGTYFETDGNVNLSPYYVNFGTTFNLKPIRYFEGGLTYNRLLFNNSMVTFSDKVMPAKSRWNPEAITSFSKEPGGADLFTFQANVTVDIGPTQAFLYGSRTQWDVDATGQNFVYDYVDDFLIKPRDRVNYGMAQLSLDLRPLSTGRLVSYTGFAVRDQYWYAEGTGIEKQLVSAGITGFRMGRNPMRQRRGLDLSLGYWLSHPQIPSTADAADSWVLLADWNWNIQVLSL